MVEKIKRVSNKTIKTAEHIYEVIATAAIIAAAIKVATLPQVRTSAGNLPVWQAVAAIMIAGVAYNELRLKNKQ